MGGGERLREKNTGHILGLKPVEKVKEKTKKNLLWGPGAVLQGVAFLLGGICFAKLERFSEIQQPRRPGLFAKGKQGRGRWTKWPEAHLSCLLARGSARELTERERAKQGEKQRKEHWAGSQEADDLPGPISPLVDSPHMYLSRPLPQAGFIHPPAALLAHLVV